MPYNGSGTFVPYTPGNPVVTGTTVSSTVQNNTINDIATGLSTAITKDGQTTVTANIPLAGFRITNVGITGINGSVGTPSINVGDAGTGFYRSAANQVGVTLNGARSTLFTAAGVVIGAATALAPLHVGDGSVNNSLDSVILISRNATNSTSGAVHGFSDSTQINRSGPTASNSFDARVNVIGTYSYDHYVAFQALPSIGTSGTTTHVYGLYTTPAVSTGAVTNSYGVYVGNPVLTLGGSMVNNYGIYVASLDAGATLNYAIYTNTGAVRFGDDVTFASRGLFRTSTAANVAGQDGYNSTAGRYIYPLAGGTSDFTLYNGAGTAVLSVPTGTANVNFGGQLGLQTSTTANIAGTDGYSATVGRWIYSKAGSAEDFTLYNGVGAIVMAVPTGTITAKFAASVTGGASIRLPHGTAPTSPVNGDMWTTTAGLFVRVNGATVGPLS